MNYVGKVEVIENNIEKSIVKKISKICYFAFKRIFDILMSIIGILLLIPVSIGVKIAYLLTGDTDSIFYKQKRIGKNGKEFNLYKFRSMIVGADEILFELLKNDENIAKEYHMNKKLKNDPRVTKIGRILRITSLDELPQVINIFLNDMSMIGNRPYLPREKQDMGAYYDEIIKSKPGLTGLWQTSGRSEVSFQERLKLEAYYSNHRTFKMDVKIFFKTFEVVFFKKGM